MSWHFGVTYVLAFLIYPIDPMAPEDGVARIGLGMGRFLEEEKGGLRFCPGYPTILPQFSKIEDILENAQQSFYALKTVGYDEDLYFSRGTNLEKRDVYDAADEYPVKMLSSRYNPDEHRIRDTATGAGFPVLTFAQVLKHDRFPLARLLSEMLVIGREGMGCPVEMEFSVNLSPEPKTIKDTFSILQIRPMSAGGQVLDVFIRDEDVRNAFCYSSQALGHGVDRRMSDIVFADPSVFDLSKTREMAGQIANINAMLAAEKRPYLLVGPGRWGSFDPWLGIPVKWKDISGVGGMVELRSETLRADASQGSHFFQRITSRGIYYLTVSEGASDFFNWEWIRALPVVHETKFIRHVRLPDPFTVKCDGKTSRCVFIPPTASAIPALPLY